MVPSSRGMHALVAHSNTITHAIVEIIKKKIKTYFGWFDRRAQPIQRPPYTKTRSDHTVNRHAVTARIDMIHRRAWG